MKPLKRSLINTAGYTAAFGIVSLFRTFSYSVAEACALTAFFFVLNYLLFSAIDYAQKSDKK